MERFGRIDVLVNNAGNFYAGFFEEISPEDFRAQIETTLFGPVNVTRAVLPVMRAQRSGLVVTISSTAGIVGQEFLHRLRRRPSSASRAGWSRWPPRSHRSASAPCSSSPASSAPSCSRPESTQYAEPSIEDYAERTNADRRGLEGHERPAGRRSRQARRRPRPARGLDEPPLRFAAGADAVATFEQKANDLLAQADAYRELSYFIGSAI